MLARMGAAIALAAWTASWCCASEAAWSRAQRGFDDAAGIGVEELRRSAAALPASPPAPESAPPSDEALARHYAPILYQDVNLRWQRLGDLPMRFDFDGDWTGFNNWEHLNRAIRGDKGFDGMPRGFDLGAYVYYGVVESRRHWFITYAVYHARDWSDDFIQESGSQHENDLEGAVLTVEKDGTSFGRPLTLQTQAHRHFFLFAAVPGIRARGKAPLRDDFLMTGSHPRLYIEAEGHGVASGHHVKSIQHGKILWLPHKVNDIFLGEGGPTRDFRGHDGFVFVPGDSAQYAWDPALARDPRDGRRREVRYALRPMGEFWDRRAAPRTVMNLRPYRGSRFEGSSPIGFSFNDAYHGLCNPPWGWEGEDLRQGDLFFDPAWAVWTQFDFSGYAGGFDPVADGAYLRNPYLRDIGARFLGPRE